MGQVVLVIIAIGFAVLIVRGLIGLWNDPGLGKTRRKKRKKDEPKL